MLIALIGTNVAWATLCFVMWRVYSNRETEFVDLAAKVVKLNQELGGRNDELDKRNKDLAIMVDDSITALEKVVDREEEWRSFVKQLTAKVPRA